MRIGARVDQLRRDAHAFAAATDAAFEHVADAQPFRHGGDVDVLAAEGEARGARRHAQARDPRERIEQLLGEPVGEILVVVPRAQVGERQYRE